MICHGYAAKQSGSPLVPFDFERRPIKKNDVLIDIAYCGVCHSDVHQINDEWHNSNYPMVPGHEIIGTVKQVGAEVTKFQVGDNVGVGCLVDSCLTCISCQENLEQFCEKGAVTTYNSFCYDGKTKNYGGYSNYIVVREEFVLMIPPGMDLARTAPLLCAGITTYSPLKRLNVGPGKVIGIIGLGGLGHVALKYAHAMGAKVILFTTSNDKCSDALKLGAHDVVLSNNLSSMKKYSQCLDFIMDTVSSDHDLGIYLNLLKNSGHFVMVGLPENPQYLNLQPFVFNKLHLSGSLIGGIAETQEMLNFSAENNILADIEIIPINYINDAFTRMLKNQVKYRFVIDMKTLDEEVRCP